MPDSILIWNLKAVDCEFTGLLQDFEAVVPCMSKYCARRNFEEQIY
jgi:hypothetical protein